MKIRETILSLLVVTGVTFGCAGVGMSSDRALAEACGNVFPSTLDALAPFKPDMTADQVKTVDTAVNFIVPSCASYFSGETVDVTQSLLDINTQLRNMLLVKRNMEGS